jgi:hemoglobin-like flavoprotein
MLPGKSAGNARAFKSVPMTPQQIALVQASFARVVPIAGTAADLFYSRLFEIAPDLRGMFPEDMALQKKKLMVMLGFAVNGLKRLDLLLPTVHALGERHAGYGVEAEDFAPVGAALLWTLEQGLGDEFTPEVAEAWAAAYEILSRAMIDAMMRKRSKVAA